jgi:hypothetical protein
MKRALLAALPAMVPAVLALGLVACGDDDDSPTTASPTATTPSATEGSTEAAPTLPGGITIPDLGSILPGGSLPDFSIPDLGSLPTNAEEILRSVFPKLSDDQLQCLLDNLGGNIDPSKVPALIQECDISPGDLIPG